MAQQLQRDMVMSWFIYFVSSLILVVAGALLGSIWTTRNYEKHSNIMVRYSGLTEKSRKLVNGYLQAREANDERTTYRWRK